MEAEISGNNTFIFGDFNTHSPLWEQSAGSNKAGREIEYVLSNFPDTLIFTPFDFQIRYNISSNSFSTIDLLLGPSLYYDLVQMVKVSSFQSDHSAILTSFQDLCYTPKPYVPTFINSKGNWSLFREILNEVDFSFVSSNSDISAIGSNLKSSLLESAKLAIPMTRLHFYNGSNRPKN